MITDLPAFYTDSADDVSPAQKALRFISLRLFSFHVICLGYMPGPVPFPA